MTATATDDLPELSSPNRYVRVRAFMFDRGDGHHHRGIDLPAPKGTPVYAARGGRVVIASNVFRTGFSKYGRVIVVHTSDGTYQLYAHLERALVAPGDDITAGQKIALVGNSVFSSKEPTRESGGAHLHFEVSPTKYPQDSEAPRIDPVSYLRAGNVHPLTGHVLGSSSSPAPSPPLVATDGSREAGTPFGSFSHCPCCGQQLPTAKGEKRDDHKG
jgi:hypothetical protein